MIIGSFRKNLHVMKNLVSRKKRGRHWRGELLATRCASNGGRMAGTPKAPHKMHGRQHEKPSDTNLSAAIENLKGY